MLKITRMASPPPPSEKGDFSSGGLIFPGVLGRALPPKIHVKQWGSLFSRFEVS